MFFSRILLRFFETISTEKPPGLSKIDEERYFQPRVLISYSFIFPFRSPALSPQSGNLLSASSTQILRKFH